MLPLPSNRSFAGPGSRDDSGDMPRDVSRDESGSAIVEFLLVALPLFIPVLILFVATNKSGQAQFNQTLLARQVLAAFTSAADDQQGEIRIRAMLNSYSDSDPRLQNITFRLNCESSPCITPGAAVEIELKTELSISGITGRQKQQVMTKARGFVDKWRNE